MATGNGTNSETRALDDSGLEGGLGTGRARSQPRGLMSDTRAAAWDTDLAERAVAAGEDVAKSLQLVRTYGAMLPLPGNGNTGRRFALLSRLGQSNLTVARVFEAHTDAIAILAEAGFSDEHAPTTTYGVFAAEGPGEPLRAERRVDGQFQLSGIKPWCSLGSELDAALITAHVTGGRQLFRVDLHDLSVTVEPASAWVARGLRTVTSTSLRFDATPAQPIGEVDWYLSRPGFSWGGIGVAACWYGGALALHQRLIDALGSRPEQLGALALGRTDALLFAAEAVLARAAASIDANAATGLAGELLALRTRATVADAVEQILRETGHVLGPAPLAFDEEHARRVADLTIYVRQHHAERDLVALGRAAVGADH
jgi:alkylation response protein AidB-like acyl-CoA dehydrogenase